MKKTQNVSIVIPNWNGKHLLEKHLRSILSVSDRGEVLVVDDGSTDDSVAFLKKNFPEVRVVVKDKHEGFASTVNVGVAMAKADIVVLLNTDIEPEKGFLKSLLSHFTDPLVFAVACMDKSKEGGHVILRGRGFAWWEKGFFVHKRGEVDSSDTAWVSGGSSAFRKSIWEALGGMDPLFNPFYWEDIDLSYRARKAGYKVFFESRSIVWHFHEEGMIYQSFFQKLIKTIAYRNQFIFIWKNISDVRLLLSHIFWTPIRIMQALLHGDIWMIVGYWAALVRLPQIFASRMKSSAHWKKSDRDLL